MKCGHKWTAVALFAPGSPREVVLPGGMTIPVAADHPKVPQECVLPKGHDGSHRSLTNVIDVADSKLESDPGDCGQCTVCRERDALARYRVTKETQT